MRWLWVKLILKGHYIDCLQDNNTMAFIMVLCIYSSKEYILSIDWKPRRNPNQHTIQECMYWRYNTILKDRTAALELSYLMLRSYEEKQTYTNKKSVCFRTTSWRNNANSWPSNKSYKKYKKKKKQQRDLIRLGINIQPLQPSGYCMTFES